MNQKNENIQGNLSVSRNATIGGNLQTRGNAKFDHNVLIKGWLDAKNIKGPCKGLYASLEKLNEAYPKPMPGWYALVGNTLPADVYRVDGREWVATGEKGGEVNLYLDQLEQDVADLDDEVKDIQELIDKGLLIADSVKFNANGNAVTMIYKLRKPDNTETQYDVTVPIVTDEKAGMMSATDKQALTLAKNTISEYNVSVLHPIDGIDGTNKYTLETAIAMVPASIRNVGIKCSFLGEDGELETWEYQGGTWNIGNFEQTGNRIISELDTCINILADIVQNGKNIYSIPDTYIGTDGNEHKTSAGYYTTDFLPMHFFDNVLIYTLYIKSESARFCAFYTADKDFIGVCENGDGTNKEINIKQLADKFENVHYVRLTIANNSTYKIYTTNDKENTGKLEEISNKAEEISDKLQANNNDINEINNELRGAQTELLGRKLTSTNLIALQNPKFIKNKYFSPSEGWTDRDNYNCHIWLEVKPNTQYYCMGDVAEFDENKEYLNLYHRPSGVSMASVTSFITSSNCKYLVLNYSNTPQYIQPGTEYTDGYWLSEINGTQRNTVTDECLDIKEKVEGIISNGSYGDPIMAGCKMVQSHGAVIDFSNAEVVSNAIIKNANIKMFSDNAKSCCGIKAATDSYIKIETDISSWNSLTFVMFCPYDTHILTTGEHSGYIRMYLNSQGNSGYGTWFNGRCHAGWNFVTITKEEIGQAVDAISNIYIKFEARDTVLNNVQFANVVLDSIIVDLKVKPTILINFDQLWHESQENGGYQKLFDNNIPATFFSKNYADMDEEDISYIKELSDIYGWELGSYSNIGASNGVIERATSYTTAKESCNETIADFVNTFMVNTVSFAATQAQCNEIGREAILKSGYIGIRYMGGLPMTYFNKEVGGWIQHHDVASLSLQNMKDELDKCITYGLVWAWFTHGICADGEQYMLMNDTQERGASSGVQKTIFNDFIDYLKTKIDAGEIQAITFKEFYRQCGVEVR